MSTAVWLETLPHIFLLRSPNWWTDGEPLNCCWLPRQRKNRALGSCTAPSMADLGNNRQCVTPWLQRWHGPIQPQEGQEVRSSHSPGKQKAGNTWSRWSGGMATWIKAIQSCLCCIKIKKLKLKKPPYSSRTGHGTISEGQSGQGSFMEDLLRVLKEDRFQRNGRGEGVRAYCR